MFFSHVLREQKKSKKQNKTKQKERENRKD